MRALSIIFDLVQRRERRVTRMAGKDAYLGRTHTWEGCIPGKDAYLLPIIIYNSTAVAPAVIQVLVFQPIASLVAPLPTLPLNRCNLVKHSSTLSSYRDCRLHASIGIRSLVYVDIIDTAGSIPNAESGVKGRQIRRPFHNRRPPTARRFYLTGTCRTSGLLNPTAANVSSSSIKYVFSVAQLSSLP